MKPNPSIANQRFGRLLVIDEVLPRVGKRKWNCICDCGVSKQILQTHLSQSLIISCGCWHLEHINSGSQRTHNLSKTVEYRIWAGIKTRCYNSNSSGYYKYGLRGIKMCERWFNSFEAFLEDMGTRPTSKHTIERKDNEGDYTPNNCKWATAKEQARNRRTTFRPDGIHSLAELCETAKVPYSVVQYRLASGWKLEDALNYPVRIGNYRRKHH